MSRFAPYLGIVLALLLGGLLAVFSSDFAAAPSSSTTASSTISIVPNIESLQTMHSGEEKPAASAPASRPETPTPEAVTKAPSPASSASLEKSLSSAPTASAPAPSSSDASLDAAAAALRGALVNIMCYAPVGSGLHSILGSGIFIDPKGIILTDAHVAQYFLLADHGVTCAVRTGSPAVDRYEAALVYISPAWIHANANVLTQSAPIGTGQYDFALLAVAKSATNAPLPATFPSVPLAETPPVPGTPVVIASYGAQFLQTNQIQSDLFPTIVFGSVKDVFTFAVNSADVIALGGSAAAQEGSSGGGVVDANGTLIGSITTSTIEGATDTRSLYAITASYIRSEYEREMGSSIDALLNQPVLYSVADFAQRIPTLESIITAGLP